MGPIALQLPVPNAAELIAYYDRVLIFRATQGTSLAGGWTEITTPSTRPHLAANQVVYSFTDPAGQPDFLYAAGFYNSQTSAVSPLGEPVRGSGDPSEGVVSVADLKGRYLFGLDLRDPAGNAMPDELFTYWRRLAVAWFERQTQVQVTQVVVEDERQDYVRPNRWTAPIQLRCHKIPVQSVQSVRLSLPYRSDLAFDTQTWRVRSATGKVTIYPQGAIGSASYGPASYGGIFGQGWNLEDIIPNGWRLSYVAGFAPGSVPVEIVDAIGKLAVMGPLAIAGDLLGGAGVSSRSLGIDGLSQSVGLVRSGQGGIYGARMSAYQAELDKAMPLLRAAYRGLPMFGA